MKDYQQILVPTDFSENCAKAAKRAVEIAEKFGGSVTLFHVVNYIPPNYVAVELPPNFVSREFLINRADISLSEWVKDNDLANCEQIVEAGQPKKLIVEKAEQIGADLVVLAPHTGSKFVRFFGSVTNAIGQALHCDTLIVR